MCNNKLIGARTILRATGDIAHIPPFDTDGHGTNVASTAAGAFVSHAGALGSLVGTASGVAPRAHLAFYKICNSDEDYCQGADILKAIETAVEMEWTYTLKKLPHMLPTSTVSYEDGIKIKEYIRSTPKASATLLFKGVVMNFPRSPAVSSISSRGPSNQFPRILKLDIIGPGVDIVGAYPLDLDTQEPIKYAEFVFMSGASMSTPHLAGVAALIKKAHPEWSPAAIKSAIMTTAGVTDRGGRPITDEKGLF
ncbi:hypothetical protein LUZ60_004239 [Juncus effusus]|nr:hypothetical protein LUZ60_004239 [Juncus effusus]